MDCPGCKGSGIKNGKYKGRQRYVCAACGLSYKQDTITIREVTAFEKFKEMMKAGEVDPTEAAKTLSVSRKTVYRWIAQLPAPDPVQFLPGLERARKKYYEESGALPPIELSSEQIAALRRHLTQGG